MNYDELLWRQSLSLEDKIVLSLMKIKDYYDTLSGQVYVSVSGGKDSTVLLHLVRQLYPDVKAVFVDTGLEHPENRDLVKSLPNVDWVKPEKSFYQVITEVGYPIPSKEQAKFINEYQTTKSFNDYLKHIRTEGKPIHFEEKFKEYLKTHPNAKRGEYLPIHKDKYPKESNNLRCRISPKWQFLADSSFWISDKCCDILKKHPARNYAKHNGLFPITGEMASDSTNRQRQYLKNGCNALSQGKIKSTPMGFWLEKDVWDYIHKYNLSYSDAYKHGLDRTGCMFCLFGITEEKVSRFAIMKQYHPELYDYCMYKLGIKDIFDLLEKQGIKLPYPYPQPH